MAAATVSEELADPAAELGDVTMRGVMVTGAAVGAIGAIVLAPRLRGATWREWLTRVAWSWAGVPSGPLGWVSCHWVMPHLHGPIYPLMAEALALRPEDELLEVACGSGVFLAEHARQVGYVAGLDLSQIQVDLARRRLAERIDAGTAEIVRGDVAQLPWPDGRFGVVTCMGSMEAFPEPPRALAEMHRVLRAGGRAVLAVGARVRDGIPTHRALGGVWVWSEPDARRLMEDAGFVDVSVAYGDICGDSPFLRILNRLVGMEDMRIVQGTKPT